MHKRTTVYHKSYILSHIELMHCKLPDGHFTFSRGAIMYRLTTIVFTALASSCAFNETEFHRSFCEETLGEEPQVKCNGFSFSDDDLKDFAERSFTISNASRVILSGDIRFLNEYLFEKFPDAKYFELEDNETLSYRLSKPYQRSQSSETLMSKINELVLGNSRVDSLENSTSFHTLIELESLQISFSTFKNYSRALVIDDLLLLGNENLRNLTIVYSNIAEITENAFKGLQNLEILILEGNLLEHLEPVTFKQQSKLATLNLADNEFQYLSPGSFWPPSLVTLDLSGNKVETITKNHFKNLFNLKLFDASYNRIRVLSPNAFASNTKLKVINLRNNRIQKITAFRNLGELEELDVSDGAVDNMQGNLFGGCRSLKRLVLRNNTIRILYAAFNPELVHLDLSLNKMQYLQGFEFNEMASLKYLDLSSNTLKRMGPFIAAIKEGTFDPLEGLEELRLENNFLEKDDIPRGLLKNLGQLKIFYLTNNGEFNFEDDVFDDLVSLEDLDYEVF